MSSYNLSKLGSRTKKIKAISIFLRCLILIVLGYIFKYVYELRSKNCKCAINNWDYKYIFYYTIIIILVNTVNIFYSLFTNKKFYSSYLIFTGIVIILNIIYIVSIFKYLKRTKDCICSQNWKKKILKGYGILLITIYSLLIIISLILIYFFMKHINNIKSLLKKKK